MDLASMLNKSGCECLNESDDHTLEHALNPKGGYLESDCDEQVWTTILIYYGLLQLHLSVSYKGSQIYQIMYY